MFKIALLFLAFISLNSCTKKEEKFFIIGEFGSFSGTESSFGINTHKGVLLAIDEINKNGGIQGHQLKVVIADNKSKDKNVIPSVNELIKNNDLIALIGEVASSRSLLAAPIAQKYKIPMISPSSTAPALTQVGDYIFRACYIDAFQGQIMANFAFKELKLKSIAIFKDKDSEYSQGLASYFIKTFEKLGGQIIADESYTSGSIDFKSQLIYIRSQKPQALFLPGYYNDVGLIARQARQLGIKVPLLGGDGWDSPQLFQIGKDSINGSFFSNHYTSESHNSVNIAFVKSYREKYGTTPDGLAAMGYDATKILLQALASTKNISHDEIRQQLTKIKNFSGVTGSISIDQNRNGVKSGVILKVDGPNHHFVTTIAP